MTTNDELLDALGELRRLLPSLRFGQLVANMALVAKGTGPEAVWDMEDDELLEAVRWQVRQLADRVEVA